MKKVFITQLLLLSFLLCIAQEKSNNDRNYTLKFPVSSLVGDISAESMGIGIGIEKKLKSSLSISQEIGYIFHVEQTNKISADVENINGLKFTTEIRKYLNKNEIPESGFFATVEMKNIFTNSDMGTHEGLRYRGSLTGNLGVLFYWDKYKKSKITLELLGGGGLGYVNANSNANPDDPGTDSNYNSANEFYPWLNLDIKIGYILK
jgi:hypothetical protein